MNSMHKILIMPALLGALLLAGCSGDQPEEVEAVRPVKAYQVADAGQHLTRSFPGQAE